MKADSRLVIVEAAAVLLSEFQRTANTLDKLDAYVAALKRSGLSKRRTLGK